MRPIRQVPAGRPRPFSFSPGRYGLQPWLILACLPLATALACLGGGPKSAADIRAGMNRLPTLTRTPLPTLTPTGIAMAGDLSPPAQPAAAAPADAQPADGAAALQGSLPTPGDGPAAAQPAAPDQAAAPHVEPPVQVDPTTTPVAPVTPTSTATAAETATLAPTPTETPTPEPTATRLPGGWVFADLRLGPASNGKDVLVLGNLINNTGSPQTLDTIDGLFYDSQGQAIENLFYTFDYPVSEVPQDGHIPFQIEIQDRPNVTDAKLEVLAESGAAGPRQDFEFLEVNASSQGNEYCVTGKVRNPGGALSSYLVIAAVLYDDQNKVINYSYDDYGEAVANLAGEQTQDVNICVDSLQQEVARYELEAWGL